MSTVSNYVAFNHVEYASSSADSQHVIAHVGPQTAGAAPILLDDMANREIDPDHKLDEEAEETAQRVIAGGN